MPEGIIAVISTRLQREDFLEDLQIVGIEKESRESS